MAFSLLTGGTKICIRGQSTIHKTRLIHKEVQSVILWNYRLSYDEKIVRTTNT